MAQAFNDFTKDTIYYQLFLNNCGHFAEAMYNALKAFNPVSLGEGADPTTLFKIGAGL